MNFISQVKKDLDILKKIIPQESTKIESLLTNISADKLVNFLVVAEDHRYKYHIGFDVIAIFRAILKNIVYKTSEGASTIEQQLVRVIINDYKRCLSRKIKEIILASYVKLVFDKRKLALIYLNIAYYGTRYQSLEAILRKYNLTKKDTIDDCICAEIVARLKYPEPLVCSVHRKKQIEMRVKHILCLYKKYSKQKNIFHMNISKYLKISDESKSIKSIYISSDVFKRCYENLMDFEQRSLISHVIVNNIPFVFKDIPLLYEQIIQYLSDLLNIESGCIKLIGSAKTGFSVSPFPDYGKLFSDNSDLDFTIISETLFNQLCREYVSWRDAYSHNTISPKTDTEKKYWDCNVLLLKKY